MKTRQYILAIILLLLSFYCVYLSIPGRYKYQFFYWYHHIGTPNFDTPLDAIDKTDQKSVMDEYKRRGYKFKCYNNNQQCHAHIKSAYGIPANDIMFGFSGKQLCVISIEFPDSSFETLNNYLNHRLDNYQKSDQIPDWGTPLASRDLWGKPLIVWDVNKGFIAASALPTPGEILDLRWISKPYIRGEILTYTEKTLPPFSPAKISDYVNAINSACENAYTASVAYAVDHPNPTNITFSNLIRNGYQPTKGVTTTLHNLNDKSGTITCSGPDEWEIRPAVITITNGVMNMTPAAAMSSSMLDSSPSPEPAPESPPRPETVAPVKTSNFDSERRHLRSCQLL